MMRDYDMARELILSAARQSGPTVVAIERLELCKLLQEAGYLHVINESTMRSERWWLTGATWKGHEAADLLADEDRWKRALQWLGLADGKRMPFDLVLEAVGRLAQAEILAMTP